MHGLGFAPKSLTSRPPCPAKAAGLRGTARGLSIAGSASPTALPFCRGGAWCLGSKKPLLQGRAEAGGVSCRTPTGTFGAPQGKYM